MDRQAQIVCLLLSVLTSSNCAVLTTKETLTSETTQKHDRQTTTDALHFSKHDSVGKAGMTSEAASMVSQSMTSEAASMVSQSMTSEAASMVSQSITSEAASMVSQSMTSEAASMVSQNVTSSTTASTTAGKREEPPCDGLFEKPNYSANVVENDSKKNIANTECKNSFKAKSQWLNDQAPTATTDSPNSIAIEVLNLQAISPWRQYSSINLTAPLILCHPDTKVSVQVLTPGVPKDKFWLSALDNRTLLLHMNGILDYEAYDPKRIDLFLKTNSEVAVVAIRILDVNDNPPVLEKLGKWKNVTIDENSPLGTLVAILHATDADTGKNAEFSYYIDADKSACPAIVDHTTGYVTLSNHLDYESTRTYKCHVNVRGKLDVYTSNYEVITINVRDVNDNAPKCTESIYQFVMSWPLSDDAFVGKITAYDRDSNENGKFSYSIESPFDAIVHINSTTGEITVIDSKAYQFSVARNVTFMAIVKDEGEPPLQGQCQVMISLIKGYQRWFYDKDTYVFSVREDAKHDDEVGEIHVNSSDVIHYRFKSSSSLNPFEITDNGIITVQGLLDYESNQSYFFVVEANDKYAYVSVNVTINIIDVNDNRPNFTHPSMNKFVVTISRLTASEAILFSVQAVDRDSGPNGNVSYYINDNMDGALFGIERFTGNIRLRQSAANIVKEELHVTVEATDNGPLKYTRYKEIVFVITNDTFNEYFYTNVTEYVPHSRAMVDIKPEQLLGIFKNISKDVSVDIVSGNEDNKFTLQTTQELTSGRLDYEASPYHELTLKVTGKASDILVGFIHVAIEVIDLNDNFPMFADPGTTHFDIPITARPNTDIYQFTAHDKDSPQNGDDVLMFTLLSSSEIVDLDPKTGIVTLKRPVTLSDRPFTVQARVNDTHNQSRALKITFNVYDPKSNAPVFDKLAYFGSVPENRPPNTNVMNAISTLNIPQTAHDVTLDILGGNKPFYATTRYDEVHTNATLDREAKSKYAIAIQSMANHHASTKTTVFGLIDVVDENDNAPKFPFSVRRFYVSKTYPKYYEIAKIKAIDKDSTSHLTYSKLNDVSVSFYVNYTDNLASLYIVDPSALKSSTLTMELYVEDESPFHNDTMEIVVTVI